MSYFHIIDELNELTDEGRILGYRAMANWCNGNLLGITRVRMANLKKFGHVDGEQMDPDVKKSMPGGDQPTPTQRGDLFASLREHCFLVAEEKNWQGFDVPRSFADYVDGRARGFRASEPTKEEIQEMVKNTLGITEEQAKDLVMKSNAAQAAQLENDKEDLVAMDSDYETSLDPEEAENRMPAMIQHRMRVKVIDAFMFECERLLGVLIKYPTFEEMRTKRELLINNAYKLFREFQGFERENSTQIQKELSGTNLSLTAPLRRHMNTLQLAMTQIKQRNAA